MESRRHHVVPRMLLKRFADLGGERIWALDLERDEINKISVSQAPVVKDFYSWIDGPSGAGRDPWLEQWLANEPEAKTGPILDKLEGLVDPDPREMTTLLNFILLQTIRTPVGQALLRHDIMEQFRALHEPLLRRDIDSAAEQTARLFVQLKHREPTTEEVFDWMQIIAAEATGVKAPSEPSRNALITQMIRALFPYDGAPLATLASQCNLARYYREAGDLVISDNPATFADVNADAVISSWSKRPPESLSLPISPHWMIELRRQDTGMPRDLWEEHLETLNQRTWQWARRFVFGSSRDVLEGVAGAVKASTFALPEYLALHRRRR